MSAIKLNISANVIGKVWAAAIVVLLIPFYIRYLGMESYGLVGFYGTLLGSMAILDLGLSTTLSRELARFRSQPEDPQKIRNLAFSLEVIYWLIGIMIAGLVVVLSGFISTHWIKAETLHPDVVKQSVALMGAVIAFQWPISLYNGGLTGLEKQVTNNIILIVMSTLRGAGVLIVLAFFSATVQAFFLWQAGLSFLYVLVMRFYLWRSMPAGQRPAFSGEQIRRVGRFALGMTGIGLISFFLSQADKIVLSKILPLTQFGYYVLAFTIATSLAMLVGPVSTAFFPRFSGLVVSNDQEALKRLYHQACRIMGALLYPIGLVLLFFTYDFLFSWTKNAATADATVLLAQIMIIGSLCNGIVVIPYNLMIAHGWTRFTIYQNIVAVIILIPLLFVWTNLYGAVGASFVWLSVNAGYVLISQPLIHRKLLPTELLNWYVKDNLLVLLPSLLFLSAIKLILAFYFPSFHLNLLGLGTMLGLSFAVTLLSMPEARQFARHLLKTKKNG